MLENCTPDSRKTAISRIFGFAQEMLDDGAGNSLDGLGTRIIAEQNRGQLMILNNW